MGSRLRRCSTRIRLCLRLIVAGKMILWRELPDLRQQKLRCLLPILIIRDLEVIGGKDHRTSAKGQTHRSDLSGRRIYGDDQGRGDLVHVD